MELGELRTAPAVKAVLQEIKSALVRLDREVALMEVCGTHTMTAYRSGLGHALRKLGLKLISGPGCPVCVTPDHLLSFAVELVSSRPRVILASFGDMLRVPTPAGPLLKVTPAEESEVKIIYSPEEALQLARNHPDHEVVFLAAGFETTIPSIAWTVKKSREEKLKNFSVIPAMKLVPPPLKAILDSGEVKLDGFIYPGHVSIIIGSDPYRFIAEEYGLPGAVTGFEPADLVLGVLSILKQIERGRPEVDIVYRRAVKPEGNPAAGRLMAAELRIGDADWRGMGSIPASGLFPPDAASALFRFPYAKETAWEQPGCRCGEVVRGVLTPEDCPFFPSVCTPDSPLGPCMVSWEGCCFIHFKYGKEFTFAED